MSYLGSKGSSGMAQFIINKMPKHDIYIEAFLGTGLIMSKKKKAQINIGIELNLSMLEQVKKKFDQNHTLLHGNSLIFLPEIIRYSIDRYNYTRSPTDSNNYKTVLYLDPPYLPETRTDFKNSQYQNELTKEDHIHLLNTLLKLSSEYNNLYIMLSAYDNELYLSMMHQWHKFTTNCMTRGGKREETLYTNFDPIQYIKHDYTFIGETYTERQRIKRKIERWKNNFNALPLDEKVLIHQEIVTSMQCQSLMKNSK